MTPNPHALTLEPDAPASGQAAQSGQPSAAASRRALTRAALALPGLGLISGLALAGTPPVAIEAGPGVSAQAAGYVPTGASKIVSVLAKRPTATRKYRISCYNDGNGEPVRMRVRVQGATKSAKFLVKATLEKDGVVQEVISLKNGPGVYYSTYAVVSQGAGEYTLTISKVRKKATDKDTRLKGTAIFKTRQECDTAATSNYYTGISKPVEIP